MTERPREFHQAGSKNRPYNYPKGTTLTVQDLERNSMDYAWDNENNRRTVLYCNVNGELQRWVRSGPLQWERL